MVGLFYICIMKVFLRRTNFLITILVVLSFLAYQTDVIEYKYISLVLMTVSLFLELIIVKSNG